MDSNPNDRRYNNKDSNTNIYLATYDLGKNNYTNPLIGFSWKSDTEWNAAKSISKWNGPLLANFTTYFMNKCKIEHPQAEEIKVRLVAHSLGVPKNIYL